MVDGIRGVDYVCDPKLENNFGSADEIYKNAVFRPLKAKCLLRLVLGGALSGLYLWRQTTNSKMLLGVCMSFLVEWSAASSAW